MSRDLLACLARWQQAHGDVVHLRIWPEHQIVVTDPALVRQLLVEQHDALVRWEHGISVFAQLHGRSVLVSEGAAWRGKRQALLPAFSPKAVQARVPMLVAAAEAAFGQWTPDEDWPLEQALTTLTMDVIARLLFSRPIGSDARAAEQAIRVASRAADSDFYWPLHWPDFMPWKRSKREALAWLRRYIDRRIEERLDQAPPETPGDLLSSLLQLHRQQPGDWPLQAVRDECMTAFLAGHETVASSLTWWAWCMAGHPEAQRKVADEVREVLQGRPPVAGDLPALRQLGWSLQEAMRLYPAAPVLISRRCTRPVQLGPWRFPARTMFMLPLGLMQRDARWFADPSAFRPERFDPAAQTGTDAAPRGSWMPFGTGPRVCLGQHLANAEMAVVAAMLLQRFALEPAEGAMPPEPVLHVTLRPARALRLKLRLRRPGD
jgi:cytochrome P450